MRLEIFKKNYEESLAYIDRMTRVPEMKDFVEWLLNVDCMAFYEVFPQGDFGASGSAEGMANLLSALYHAIVDDGEFTIIKVNGRPRIVFCDEHNVHNLALSEFEKGLYKDRELRGMGNTKNEIEVLEIELNEFPKLYTDWIEPQTKRRFLSDCRVHGVEAAKQWYPDYKEEWLNEHS